jgi:hypothetical protein
MNIWQKIKFVLGFKSEYAKIADAYKKNGTKTSEFWLVVLSSAISVWFSIQGVLAPEMTAKIVAACVMVYTIARAIAKFTPTKLDDEIMDKIDAIIKKKMEENK